MKHLLTLIILFTLFLAGCASHYRQESFESPLHSVQSECMELGNGSTSCVKHEKVEVDPQYGMPYGPYGMPPMMYAGGVSAPPPVLMLQTPTTSGQRAMENVGGGVAILHPADLTAVGDPRVTEHDENLNTLNKAVTKIVKQLKKENP